MWVQLLAVRMETPVSVPASDLDGWLLPAGPSTGGAPSKFYMWRQFLLQIACCCLQNRLQETLETMTRDTSKLLRQLTERLASASEETSKKIGGLQELHEKIPELVSQQLSQLGSQLTSLNQAASTLPALVSIGA